MKTASSRSSQQGAVLVTTLVIALLVGIVVGALLLVSQQQNYLTSRSGTWSSALPMAEAGVEEAMAHLNSRPKNFATNGWNKSGSNYVKYRPFTNGNLIEGYYFTRITTAAPPTIVSSGFGRIPLQTNFTRRTVMAVAKLTPPGWGIVGKNSVNFNGNPFVDSYDSSDPEYSTNGKWDVNRRSDRVGVGTLSTNAGAISTGSNGEIFGSAATGPGGTVTGSVGDGAWLANNSGLQPGHVTDDFNMAIPNATLPTNFSTTPLSIPLPGLGDDGKLYGYILNGGDWRFGATSISTDTGSIYVKGKVRIHFTGQFKMSGSASVTLAPGATLEIYLGGNMDLSGHCVINPTGIPGNCSIFGLSGCTDIKYSGTAEAFCKLYAPQADITITGDFDFSGSVVGNNVRFSGNASVHYDEALNGEGPDYKVVSWEEL